jgi:hypothetical protein
LITERERERVGGVRSVLSTKVNESEKMATLKIPNQRIKRERRERERDWIKKWGVVGLTSD